MGAEALRVGVAATDITPSVGIHMGGYWGRRSGAVDVHDPLMGRVLTIIQGSNRCVLIALDLVGLDAGSVRDLRARIHEKTRIPETAVLVCCTHTHAGPLTLPFRGMGEVDVTYLDHMLELVAETVLEAQETAVPVRLSYARTAASVGVNRRQERAGRTVIGCNPAGPVAAYAHVVRFDSEQGLRAVLFSHACHGTVLGGGNHSISADFPGAAVRYVERKTGARALFVNGACGDINPRLTNADFDAVEMLGAELGAAVVAALPGTRPVRGQGVRWASRVVPLPLLPPPPRWRAEVDRLALQLKGRLRLLQGARGDTWAQRGPRARLAWGEAMLAQARCGRSDTRTQPFELQTLAVGELVLLGLEGEAFVRYQLDIEARSPLPYTMVCGYANGCIGYVPTADEYGRGGYEIDTAYKVYPTVSMIAPDSERMIRQCALQMLEDVQHGA